VHTPLSIAQPFLTLKGNILRTFQSTAGVAAASLLLVAATLLAACSANPHKVAAPAVSPSVAANVSAGSTTDPSGSAATSNTHLLGYSTNDGPDSTVILTGAIGDTGQGESIYANGAVDPDHSADLKLTLRTGSLRISIADLDKRFVDALKTASFNTQTCSGRVSVTAATPIVPGSGTGLYRGITGSFELTLGVDEVVDRSSCSFSGPTAGQLLVIEGEGTVSQH
jgi:hypothetical protein